MLPAQHQTAGTQSQRLAGEHNQRGGGDQNQSKKRANIDSDILQVDKNMIPNECNQASVCSQHLTQGEKAAATLISVG